METKREIEITPEMAQALDDAFQPVVDALLDGARAIAELLREFFIDPLQNICRDLMEWMRVFYQEVRKITESLNRRQINQFRRGFFYAKMVDRGVPAWLARWISRLCPIQLIR